MTRNWEDAIIKSSVDQLCGRYVYIVVKIRHAYIFLRIVDRFFDDLQQLLKNAELIPPRRRIIDGILTEEMFVEPFLRFRCL